MNQITNITKRRFKDGTEFEIECDLIVSAIGQMGLGE